LQKRINVRVTEHSSNITTLCYLYSCVDSCTTWTIIRMGEPVKTSPYKESFHRNRLSFLSHKPVKDMRRKIKKRNSSFLL